MKLHIVELKENDILIVNEEDSGAYQVVGRADTNLELIEQIGRITGNTIEVKKYPFDFLVLALNKKPALNQPQAVGNSIELQKVAEEVSFAFQILCNASKTVKVSDKQEAREALARALSILNQGDNQ